jgi:hypothetical protein
VLHMNIAKVDRHIAYATMAIHICCKRLFQMFHLFFPDVCCKCVYSDVAYVSHICCKCSIWMLQMFYLDVAYVLQWLFKCFQVLLQVFQIHVSSVSYVFRRMLQMFHLDVSKVERVLHMLQ